MLTLAQPVPARSSRGVATAPLSLLTLVALLLAIAPRYLQGSLSLPMPAVPAPRVALPRAVPRAASASHPFAVPAGIRASVEQFVQARADARYWLHRAPAAGPAALYTAQSAQQQLTARFAAGGLVTVQAAHGARATLRVAALNGQPVPARLADTARNTLTYRHGALAEWWRNGPLGVEQGFTIPSPALAPRGQATVRVDVTVSTAIGRAGAGLRFGDLRFGNVLSWDARGRLLPVRAAWQPAAAGHAGRYSLTVSTRGARFPVTIDPTLSLSTAQGDAYPAGRSIAMSGDGGYLAIGTFALTNLVDGGGVLLFQHPANGWTSDNAQLVNPQAVVNNIGYSTDQFGSAIALNRDGSVLLVGAPGWGNNAGAAYVYVEPAGGWSQGVGNPTQALWDPQTLNGNIQTAPGDEFGAAVALDATGSVAAISAYGSNYYAGYVYVYQPAGGVSASGGAVWSNANSTPVTFTDPCTTGCTTSNQQGRSYGFSLAMSADGNTLLVGAPQMYGDYGQAYLYLRSQVPWNDGTMVAAPTVTFFDPAGNQTYQNGDYFAQAVALSGDASTVLIGAYGQPGLNGNPNPGYPSQGGTAYLFAQPSGGWASVVSPDSAPTTIFTDPDNAVGDGFGGNVALTGSGTAAVIGALGAAGGEGKVYVYGQPLGGWTSASGSAPAVTFTDPNPSSTPDGSLPVDAFGLATALGGSMGVGGAMNEPTITEASAQTYLTGDTYTVSIPSGWSLFSPPLLPLDPSLNIRASELVQQVYAQTSSSGSGTVALYMMQNNAWTNEIVETNGSLNTGSGDYFLQPGVGYLLYSNGLATVSVAGVQSTGSSSLSLPSGWSLIGVPQRVNGATIMASTEVTNLYNQVAAAGGSLVALDALTNGSWSPSATDNSGTITYSSTDFPLTSGAGYLVYVAKAAVHTYVVTGPGEGQVPPNPALPPTP